MRSRDPRIDTYIADSARFARPILKHLRKLIHQGCPSVVETIKWGAPFFEYHGLLFGFAAFKAHCALIFWRGIDVSRFVPKSKTATAGMGQFGKITSRADLPSDPVLLACIRSAVEQRDAAAARPKSLRPATMKKDVPVPADLKKALTANAPAATTFKRFTPGHRREYITWITDAKRPETRARRLATTVQWLAEGKPQNWKYRAKTASASTVS